MNNIELIFKYNNGNYTVELYSDGTKIRSTIEDEFIPNHPESIDLKITNYCDAGCKWCHEDSTIRGKHASIDFLMNLSSELPAGMEIAIGGGNPLDYPTDNLYMFLKSLKDSGKYSNITMNAKHYDAHKDSKKYIDMTVDLIQEDLIKGLGISINTGSEVTTDFLDKISPILKLSDNVVFHAIIGVTKPEATTVLVNYYKALNKPLKLLLLGFKDWGRGLKCRDNESIAWWKKNILSFLLEKDMILCFDTLGLEQTHVKRHISETVWDEIYLGDESMFTFYVDAVKEEYSTASYTSDRKKYTNVVSDFQSLRRIYEYGL